MCRYIGQHRFLCIRDLRTVRCPPGKKRSRPAVVSSAQAKGGGGPSLTLWAKLSLAIPLSVPRTGSSGVQQNPTLFLGSKVVREAEAENVVIAISQNTST